MLTLNDVYDFQSAHHRSRSHHIRFHVILVNSTLGHSITLRPVQRLLRCVLGFFFFKDFIYLFLERGEGKEKDRERNIHVWLPLMSPLLRSWPTTESCALTGNRTSDSLVCRPTLSLQSYTSQGSLCFNIHRFDAVLLVRQLWLRFTGAPFIIF